MGRRNVIGATYRGTTTECELCDYTTPVCMNPFLHIKLHYKAVHKDTEPPLKFDCNDPTKPNTKYKINIGNKTELMGRKKVPCGSINQITQK